MHYNEMVMTVADTLRVSRVKEDDNLDGNWNRP
jgi:hypothetical protein